MNRFLAAALLGAACLLQGCSDDSSIQPVLTPGFELQASVVIGPAGGQVGTSEFILTVPEGAFDSDYLLSVYGHGGTTTLPAITRRFRLEGLPSLYAKPLHVSILQTDSLQVNKVMTVGRSVWVPAAADNQLVGTAYAVKDSTYRLVITLPATRITGKSSRDEASLLTLGDLSTGLTFEGRSGYRVLNSIDFDGGLPAASASILTGASLEAALDSLGALGFDYTADGVQPVSSRINTGVETEWNADVSSYAYLPRLGDRRSLMLRFDQNQISVGGQWSSNPALPRAARALCDLYAQVYDPNYSANAHLWLHKAVGLWAEQRFVHNDGYLPPDFVGHARAPFDGIVNGSDGPRAQVLGHGYGMAPMITYLVDRAEAFGNHTFVADVYTRILNHTDPTAALLLEAPVPVTVWWPDFLTQYVKGNVWPIYPAGGMNYDGHATFYAGGDTTLTFTKGMRDLSARLYRIGLKRPGLGPTAEVRFKLNAPNIADDEATIVVLRNKNGIYEELGRGHSVTINDIASLNDAGYELYALVTDARHAYPYTGLSTVTLTATLAEPVDLDAITQGGVRLGGMRVYWGYSPDTCGTAPAYSTGVWLYTGRSGSFVGNTFTSVWNDTTSGAVGDIARSGRMTITVSQDQTKASFEITETITDFESGCTTLVRISGRDIAAVSPDDAVLEYDASGSTAAAKLTVEQREICPDSGCDVVIKSLSYTTRSGVVVDFW